MCGSTSCFPFTLNTSLVEEGLGVLPALAQKGFIEI